MKTSLILLIVSYLFCTSASQELLNAIFNFEDALHNLQNEMVNHFKFKKHQLMEITKLKQICSDLKITSPLEDLLRTDRTLCGVCRLLMKEIQQRTLTVKVIGEAICKVYITISTLTVSNFCSELIRINLPILEYILENSRIFDPEFACTVLLQNDNCYFNKSALGWRSQVPSEATKKIPQVNYDPNAKPLKILHLTDLHISTDYEVDGITNCGYPVCCKRNIGNPFLAAKGRAGMWGDYNCDIPPWLFENAVRHINQTHKDIDLVYFTGDIIDHTVWKSSKENNTNLMEYTFKTLYESFPNITVLPVIGNHEATPLNVFAPNEPALEQAGISTQWLYRLLSKLWCLWLPSEALETVQKQGYYYFIVNKLFKVIVLNNNICYNFNWWVLYNTTFFTEQLNFLSTQLEDSEAKGQFVHIIAHIPGGNKECVEPWEVSFNSLIRRFSHIISAQFYGHTHTDELKVFYDENRKPINVGYNGASLTPFLKYNPNYKIMTVDPNTYRVLDIDTYIFNLTHANQYTNRSPAWFKLYSMKDAYGLDDLSPGNFDKLTVEMFKNDTLFHQYWRYYVREGDASLSEGCDEKCKKEIICKIVTTESLAPAKKECENA